LDKVTFKNVGQGDSIILEWDDNGVNRIGIIDCNIYENKNPIVEYLSIKNPKEIEFIVLSHFHYDHFSGMPELFNFCIFHNIKIKLFLHTLSPSILNIYDKISKTKKIEQAIKDFFSTWDIVIKNIENDSEVNFLTELLNLSDSLKMKFIGPSQKYGKIIASQINKRIENKDFSYNDINKFSTIIYLCNDNSSILLTADSTQDNFKHITDKITKPLSTIQVPHHGSFPNILSSFWKNILKDENCNAIFSVGKVPKDKLPNLKTVEFFDKEGFDVNSTNAVYGIEEYFELNKPSLSPICEKKTICLNHFSKKVDTIYRKIVPPSKYYGDRTYNF